MTNKYVECFWKEREFDNESSEVRDFLSNERTYLAWLRTALTCAGLGIIVVKLFAESSGGGIKKTYSTTLGALLTILSMVILIVGTLRYVDVFTMIARDKFPSNGKGLLLMIIFMLLIFVAVFVLIVI